MTFYDTGRSERDFETGIQKALERLLVAPEFLFRIERDPEGIAAGTAYRISALELASRLSFFLWSSLPDDELLGVAETGRLREPDVLEQQVRRMLADSRAAALVDDFASQWLHLRRVRGVTPDADVFYEFDENLRLDMERETTLFLESQLRDDRSVLDLLTANYTFVNERLARHYGLSGIYGERFRRVDAPGRRPLGLARARECADPDRLPDPHVAGAQREVAARQYPWGCPRRLHPLTCRHSRKTTARPCGRSGRGWSSIAPIRHVPDVTG